MTNSEIPNTIVREGTLSEELSIKWRYWSFDSDRIWLQCHMERTKLLINWRWLLVLQVIIVSALMLLFALTVSVSSVDETGMPRSRRDVSSRVKDIVLNLVLCLNASFFSFFSWRIFTLSQVTSVNMVLWHIKHPRWTSTVNQIASIGQTLVFHDRAHIRRLTPSGSRLFDILFLQRGPDVLMAQRRDAREGLRTHVITRKRFSPKVGEEVSWCECVIGRNEVMRNVIGEISEHDWEFLGWMIFEECRDEDLDTEGR